MSTRKLSQRKDIDDRDGGDEEADERAPLFPSSSSGSQGSQAKGERHMRRGILGKCCFIIWRLKYIILACFLLFTLFLFIIGSFQVSNVEEIILHPGSFRQYWEHFEHSIGAIGQDSGIFDSLKATRPKTYSEQDKARLDLANNPNHLVWGGGNQKLQSCVKVNETYLLMVLNTPNAISDNMHSFVKMSSEKNQFIISRTYDFLPSHPSTPEEFAAKEKTMTSYFSNFYHKTVSVANFPYLDFKKYQLSDPVYIGTVRDPIARLQSHYETKRGGHDSTRISSRSFQDCVRAFIRNNVSSEHLVFGTDAENLGSLMLPHDVKSKILKLAESHKCFSPEYLNVQVMAYCGLDCGYLRRETAEKSVQIAISHMNEQFRVIVVAEQLLSSVKLLERVVPEFFSGLNEKAATMLRLFAQTTPVPTPAPTPLPSPAPSPSPIPIPVQEVVQPFRCPNRDGYCSCDGTLYYGQAYVDAVRYRPSYDGQMLSFEDMIKIKHVSRDVSATGGAMCSHKLFGDPLVGYAKQCYCDPNKSKQRNRRLRATPSSGTPPVKSKKDENNLSSQVKEYLLSVLRYEYRLYAAAKQHLAINTQQCAIA